MGQKVNPHGIRVGVIKDWGSRWYAEADFADYLVEDYNIRKFLKKKLYSAGVSDIEIERASDKVKIIIHTAKPGVVIGKGGAEIEKLKVEVSKYTTKKVFIDIKEIKRPDRDAQLVAESIAQQLENRIAFRRAMKSTMSRSMKSGVLGIKTCCSGRLGGADMARTEFYSEGTIPLQTLRADLDPCWIRSNQIEAARVAMTRYIKRGGKVWIKIFPDKPVTAKPAETRMGSGKGSTEYWVAVVKPGRVLFEIAGVPEDTAREALRLAMHKLPCRCKIVSKADLEGGEKSEN